MRRLMRNPKNDEENSEHYGGTSKWLGENGELARAKIVSACEKGFFVGDDGNHEAQRML
jgi:hypothetical protein